MKSLRHVVKHTRFTPFEVTLLIAISAFLYTLMEWLFIIAKASSFLYSATFLEKLFILFNSSAFLCILVLVAFLPFMLLFFCFRGKIVRTIFRFVLCLVPSLIIATLVLLLVDNTTYQLFSYGIVSTKGVFRVLYLVGFILLFLGALLLAFRFANSLERTLCKKPLKQKVWIALVPLLLLLFCAGLPVALNPAQTSELLPASAELESGSLPNILLITADGLNAVKLSLYGAAEETTPFLSELADTSLVAENAFSNAQGTIGSTTSILTGKYPADTRVLIVTDILKGENALEHLPGILESHGYYSVQLSFSYYADAYRINFQNAFDEANGESPVQNEIQSALAKILPTNYYYFMREEYSRISDRLEHLFYIKKMTNPFLQVTESPEKFNDQEKLDYLFQLLDQSEQPVFVHIHWMGTHGPKYYPEEQVFSVGQDPELQGKYEEDFYLDSILEFDKGIEQVYAALEERNLVDQTVLVVGGDHTQRWSNTRIPLLIHFPESEYAGKVFENVQNLDISPTLLDYLNIEQPEWMAGQSLLTPLDVNRPIFLASIPDSKKDPDTGKVTYPQPKPPFYQFGKMTVILCDHYYLVNFAAQTMKDSKITGYIGECENSTPSREEALRLIIEHLEQYGFDASELSSISTE